MIPLVSCLICKNFIKDKKCKAFEVIPDDIWLGKNDHKKKHPEQTNNILFEPIEPKKK